MILKKLKIVLIFIFLFITFSATYAQNFNISKIHPYIYKDSLKLQISCKNVFDKKIKKALFAGIPLSIEIKILLTDNNTKVILNQNIHFVISYEVWEEDFYLTGNNFSNLQFSSMESLNDYFVEIDNISLIPLNKIEGEKHQIEIHTKLMILTSTRNKQLKRWLEETTQTEEELPSQNRSTGFKLNLNQFISLFMDKNSMPDEYIEIFYSGPFSIQNLENR